MNPVKITRFARDPAFRLHPVKLEVLDRERANLREPGGPPRDLYEPAQIRLMI